MRSATIGALLCLVSWSVSDCVAAGGFTESEALLGGFKQLETTDAYPASLEIPAGWNKAFLEMLASTAKNNKEVGACLQLTAAAKGEQQRETAMAEYAALLAKQATLLPDDFTAQEAQLRQRIEQAGEDAGGATEWTVGNVQGGDKTWTVNIEQTGVQCNGESLGTVHTHPKDSMEVHSDSDLNYTLYKNLPITAVLHGHKMCLLIRSTNLGSYEDGVQWRFGATIFSSVDFTSESLIVRRAVARLMLPQGRAYYCGVIGKPLEKVAPGAELPNNKRQMLATKALVVMRANDDPLQKIPLDFPFTPQLDAQFLKVVGTLLPNDSASEIKNATAKALFEKLAPVVMPEDGMAFFSAMTFPDFRSLPTGGLFRAFYCDFSKKLQCEIRSSIDAKHAVVEASYDESSGESRIAMRHPGTAEGYTLQETYERTGIWIKAEGKIHNLVLDIDGPGLLKTPHYEWKGYLHSGLPTGQGQARRKGEKQWQAARADDGIVSILAGPQP